ncbi:DedA family protein [Actinocorallia longicatena]|uniref:VTT domain-containing protein n=1 Tax=Actinocorallia longicatena TaxID=111803 RepID=A0ABP6QJM6_9ACTN
MLDVVMEYARDVMDSPIVYLVIFAVAMGDAIIPMVPSDAVVVTAGVFAASGKPNILLVMVAALLGAIAGDHVSYWIGRAGGGRFARRKGGKTDRIRHLIEERGGLVLFVARYIPGGRTVTTLTMGALRYPQPKFTAFDCLASAVWAVQWALVGYFGGHAFEDDPVKALLLGFGIAAAVTVIAELVRRIRNHTKKTQHA